MRISCSDTLVNPALQTILRRAGKLVLIVTEKQYGGAVDGSIPVLINFVSSNASNWIFFSYVNLLLILLYLRSTGWRQPKNWMTYFLVMQRYSKIRDLNANNLKLTVFFLSYEDLEKIIYRGCKGRSNGRGLSTSH